MQTGFIGLEGLVAFLDMNKIHCQKDLDMSRESYFMTGGPLRLAIYPRTVEQVRILAAYLFQEKIPYRVFGATSNCMFLNERMFDVFVFMEGLNFLTIDPRTAEIVCGAGLMLPVLAKKASLEGVSGFEGLCGIPGTVGGAVFMNAGAFGNDIAQNLIEVVVIDECGQKKIYKKKDLDFGFRRSLFQKQRMGIIVEARFRAVRGDHEESLAKISRFVKERAQWQEHRFLNLGSIFPTFDIYKEIEKRHPGYVVVTFLNRIYCRIMNPKDNKFINALTAFYFRFDFSRQPYSDKTLNCLINTGDNYRDVLKFLRRMGEIFRGELPMENEIVGSENGRVGILTFCDGINYGAFWQVYSTQRFLQKNGYDVQVIRYKNLGFTLREYGVFFTFRFPRYSLRNIYKVALFRRAQRKLNLTPRMFKKKALAALNFDRVVIGSDEVWNCVSPLIGVDPVYFGAGIRAQRIISYAASFGTTRNPDDIPPSCLKELRQIARISVRDENSASLVKAVCGSSPEIVLDPTFLIDLRQEAKDPGCRGYILVYGLFSESLARDIQRYARRLGKKTIAVGYRQAWCDESADIIDPFKWLGYFVHADAVVTTMYHGLIFSIIHRKDFCFVRTVYRAHKVGELLRDLGIGECLIDEKGSVDDAFKKKIDYQRVGELLAVKRARSQAFLLDAVHQ